MRKFVMVLGVIGLLIVGFLLWFALSAHEAANYYAQREKTAAARAARHRKKEPEEDEKSSSEDIDEEIKNMLNSN